MLTITFRNKTALHYRVVVQFDYLAASFALALLGAPVDPMVMCQGLFSVLPHTHISKCRFAGELDAVYEYVDTRGVGHNLAC